MRLSLKISAFTAIGILLVLSTDGYLRGQRELRSLRNDIERDHRALGRILVTVTTVTAERAGPKPALQLLEDVNFRESGIDIRWHERARQGVSDAPRAIVSKVETNPTTGDRELVTMIPLVIGSPGDLVLRESLASADSYVFSTIRSTLGTSLLLIALSTLIIFGVGWWLLGTPLRLLVARARAIGEGDLDAQLVLRRNDEMGELAHEMNSMSRRLSAAHELADREAAGRLTALQQLRHAERLTTVGKLASGIAHELGTPLNVVDARAQMIARGESSGSGAQQDATIISEQARRMTQIIQQLLDFARPRRAQKVRQDLSAIVRMTLDLLRHLATRHGVTLRVTGDTDVYAAVDVSQMQQLTMNLVVNAIHAQPNGGEVRIGAHRGRGAAQTSPAQVRQLEQETVCLVIEDDGIGMTPDVRERMFEPFFTTKEVGQGTGLGLSVVYGIVEEHAGEIDVRTAAGAGTCITVVLPQGRDDV
ncbi:MAG TPA: HAMP domain-containing sensor histidine kinase [Polyangiales bacterium]|nr:HAMP domain-containing sensor histidine kinase [Polyangiales bacterium]